MRSIASLAVTVAAVIAIWGPVYLEAKPWTGAVPVEGGMGYEHVYLGAARAVRAGGSPYQVTGYTYPPTIAWSLALLDERHAAALWRALVLVSAGLMGWAAASQLDAPWGAQAALAVYLGAVAPWTVECLETAQAQLPAGAAFACSLLALRRGRGWLAGGLLAGGLLLKPSCLGWPIMLMFGSSPTQAKAGTLATAVLVVAFPVLAFAHGGGYLEMMYGGAFRAWVADAQNLAPLAGAYWRLGLSPIIPTALLAAWWIGRERQVGDRGFILAAPWLALAVLPLVWGYTLTLLYPGLVAAADVALAAARRHRAEGLRFGRGGHAGHRWMRRELGVR